MTAPPGIGKTHLAIALAYRAIQNGFDARRSAFVPINDMRHWLTTDADYAVIDTVFLDYKLTIPSLGNPEQQIKDLVARHFELIDTVDEFRTRAPCRKRAPAAPRRRYRSADGRSRGPGRRR